MNELDASMWGLIFVGVLSGLTLGVLHLALLRKSTELYLKGRGVLRASLFTALRFAVALGLFWVLAKWNAIAAIAALLGFSIISWSVFANPRAN